jgi:hypothetical protein
MGVVMRQTFLQLAAEADRPKALYSCLRVSMLTMRAYAKGLRRTLPRRKVSFSGDFFLGVFTLQRAAEHTKLRHPSFLTPVVLKIGSSGFPVKGYSPQRHSAATPQPKKRNFYHEGTKSTKLRSLEISMSETFVAFVCFVVRWYF